MMNPDADVDYGGGGGPGGGQAGGGQANSAGQGGGNAEVCKDFLRGSCNRGNKCKYAHQGTPEPRAGGGGGGDGGNKGRLSFCRDFQNKGCFRPKCRFIHCSRGDEDDYKRSGKVTEFMAIAILAAGQGSEDDIAGTPICKDFKIGRCDRGRNRCRYWHIDPNPRPGDNGPMRNGPMRGGPGGGEPPGAVWAGGSVGGPQYNMPPAMAGGGGGGPYGGAYGGSAEPPMKRFREDNMMSPSMAQEEVLVLRQKLDLYKKQVVDLSAANEVLLEQNARLRAKLQVATSMGAGQGQEAAAPQQQQYQQQSQQQYQSQQQPQYQQQQYDQQSQQRMASAYQQPKLER